MSNKLTGILLDIDGTLIDSNDAADFGFAIRRGACRNQRLARRLKAGVCQRLRPQGQQSAECKQTAEKKGLHSAKPFAPQERRMSNSVGSVTRSGVRSGS